MIWLMLPDGTRIICIIWLMFPGLDLCCADPAQSLTTASEELDYLDHDLSDLCDLSDLDHDLSDLSEEWNDLSQPKRSCVVEPRQCRRSKPLKLHTPFTVFLTRTHHCQCLFTYQVFP